jgi:hypothetical protein
LLIKKFLDQIQDRAWVGLAECPYEQLRQSDGRNGDSAPMLDEPVLQSGRTPQMSGDDVGIEKGLFSQLSGWKIACDSLETP